MLWSCRLKIWTADDAIGLDEITKGRFPIELVGLSDGFPAGATGDTP